MANVRLSNLADFLYNRVERKLNSDSYRNSAANDANQDKLICDIITLQTSSPPPLLEATFIHKYKTTQHITESLPLNPLKGTSE